MLLQCIARILYIPFRCRADEIVFYAAILAPFALTYSFNLIIYILIIGSLSWKVIKKRDTINKAEMQRKEYKRLAIVAFFLAIMFGLAWIFGVLVVIPDTAVSHISQYFFSFFVGFQGVLYLIMHGIRSPDARKFWLTLLYKPCPSRIPNFLRIWTTTSPYQQTKPTNLRSKQNPLYGSQDNLLSSPGESTFNTLQRPQDMSDIGASPSSYSLASQTVKIDFTLPTIISDDEESNMDMQDLTEIINTKFTDPNAPGIAVSPPLMPISSAHENIQINALAHKMRMNEAEFTLHAKTDEDANTVAYDSVFQEEKSSPED